jgi:hypothetical protein
MAASAYYFGAGNVYIIPSGTNPSPVQIGTVQEVSLDISFESKELHGNLQFPVMVARSKGKITGKAKAGEFRGNLMTSLLSGASSAVGRRIGAREGPTAIPGTPWQITVTNSATWVEDMGVINATLGTAMTRVASGPTTGQYSVAAGVYTFASADNVSGYSVFIAYSYTSAATGHTIAYTNQLMGTQSIYTMNLFNTTPDGNAFGIKLYSVVFPKLALGFKNDDFTMPDLDLAAFADSSGNILSVYIPE